MSKTIRDAYGDALAKYGSDDRVFVLDADASSSTRSAYFGEKYPARFINTGIAELNMTGIAAGLAACGKIPFVNTFAVFISTISLIAARAFGSYSKLNIKLMGAYGGLSDSYDGASHQSLEDIAVMRSLPNIEVYVASDEYQTDWLVKNAIQRDAPMYIRLSREAMPAVYKEGEKFIPGKAKTVVEGSDVSIIACGLMTGTAVKAAVGLKERGINAEVIDMFCVKPIDRETIINSAKKTNAVVTAEEHSVIGGLGGAVAEVLTSSGVACVQEFIGVKDHHGESGAYDELLDKYCLNVSSIEAACVRAIDRKR